MKTVDPELELQSLDGYKPGFLGLALCYACFFLAALWSMASAACLRFRRR